MRLAFRSSTYVLIPMERYYACYRGDHGSAFYFLSDLGPHAMAILKAYGAGALIAMTAESRNPGGLP